MTPPTLSDELTLEQARVILNCRDLYPHDVVLRAANWMAVCRTADYGDIELACGLLGFGTLRSMRLNSK